MGQTRPPGPPDRVIRLNRQHVGENARESGRVSAIDLLQRIRVLVQRPNPFSIHAREDTAFPPGLQCEILRRIRHWQAGAAVL